MTKFKYDDKTHLYFLNNKAIPSVTEIIGTVLPRYNTGNDFYLNKGKALHKAIALILQDNLDETTIDERLAKKVAAGKKAIQELQIQPILIETPLCHKTLGFAGTPDVLDKSGRLFDIKSSHEELTVIPQLGGYYELLVHNKYKVKEINELVLQDNGKYKLYKYDIKYAKQIFLAVLTVYNHIKRR